MIYNKLFLASLMALVAQGTVQATEYSGIFDGEYGNKFNFFLSNKYNDTNNYNDIDNDKYNNYYNDLDDADDKYDNYKSCNYYYLKSKLNNNYYDEDELDKIATDDEDNKYDEYPENNDNDNSFNSVLDDMRENLNNQKARVQYLYCKNARQSNIISDMRRNNRSILLRNDRLNFQNQMLYNNNSILQNDLQRSVIKQEEQKLEIERLKDRVEQLEIEKLNNAITVSNTPDDKPEQELPPVPDTTQEEQTKSVGDNAPAPSDNPKVEENAAPAEVPSKAEEQAKAQTDDTAGSSDPAEEKLEFDKALLSELQDIIDNKDLSKDTDAFVMAQELLKNIKVIPVKINQEDTNKFIELWKTYDDKQKPNLDKIFNEMLYNNLPDDMKKNYSDHKIFPLSDAMNFCINKDLVSDTPFWQEKNKNLLYAYFYWHIASKTEEEQKANEKFNDNNIDKEYIELIYGKYHKEFLEPHIKNYYSKKNLAILNNKEIKDNNEKGKLINENSSSMNLDLNNVAFANFFKDDIELSIKLVNNLKFREVLDFMVASINEVNKETENDKKENQKDNSKTETSNSNKEKDNKTEINSNQSDNKNNNETQNNNKDNNNSNETKK